jgi:hypothetical protein
MPTKQCAAWFPRLPHFFAMDFGIAVKMLKIQGDVKLFTVEPWRTR